MDIYFKMKKGEKMWVCKRCGETEFVEDIENEWIECEYCGNHTNGKDDIETIAEWVDYKDL